MFILMCPDIFSKSDKIKASLLTSEFIFIQGIVDTLNARLRQQELIQHDCFVLVLSSHGKGGSITAADGNDVKIQFLVDMLNNTGCPALVGKPKLVFVSACRGGGCIN